MLAVQTARLQDRSRLEGAEKRSSNRRAVAVPGRLVWKDKDGTTRIATVMTRDVSEQGALVECLSGSAIPLYRLVDFHVERADRERAELPNPLRRSQVLAAVYRVGPYSPTTGTPQTYALRLLVRPERRRVPSRPADLHAGVVDSPDVMTA